MLMDTKYLAITCAILAVAVLSVYCYKNKDTLKDTFKDDKKDKIEKFDATGYVYNVPPNWFIKTNYNPSYWVVRTFPDQI
jgi:hypothetical protein